MSIACHGLLRARPVDGEPVLIVGAGIIGLASLAALRGLFPACPVTVLARHPHQADAAQHRAQQLGYDEVRVEPDLAGRHRALVARRRGSE